MKRFSMLMLLAAATYALTGCVVTDYPCITDTQDYNTECGDHAPQEGLLDTQGWAHMLESGQTATDNDGDGLFTVFGTFLKQDTDGNQQLAALAWTAPNDPYQFQSDLYSNPPGKLDDRSIWSYAIYTNSTYTGAFGGRPGATGDITGSCAQGAVFDPFWFDYQFGTACTDADGDLSTLTSYFTRTGEVGRSLSAGAGVGVPLSAKLAILQAGEITEDGMLFTVTDDIEITLTQGDVVVELDLSALHGKQFELDPSNIQIVGNDLLADAGIGADEYLAVANQFAGFERQSEIVMTVDAYGQTFDIPFALSQIWDAERSAAAIGATAGGDGSLGRRR